jgi:hypothetical protein
MLYMEDDRCVSFCFETVLDWVHERRIDVMRSFELPGCAL